jgi:type 2 lantibiotic biosynthesis protein LanM
MEQKSTNFLAAADRIGAQLCRDALRDGTRANWMGDSKEYVGNAWVTAFRVMGPDLYCGTAGIALFLAQLYRATGEKLYRSTAEAGAAHALSRLDDIVPMAKSSFYMGQVGIAYALLEIGGIFGDKKLVKKSLDIIKALEKDDLSDQGVDVVSGSAGTIPALLAIYSSHKKDFLLDSAVAHGERLLGLANKTPNCWSWNTMGTSAQNDLAGFSHGTAGIAWAFLELSAVTGEKKYREAAEMAFAYERQHYNAQQENWPDFRGLADPTSPAAGTVTYPVAWCHGAAGIGLSRLRAFELLKEDIYRQEAETAIRTTSRMFDAANSLLKADCSLCHGATGNAELLIYGAKVLGNTEYKAAAERIGETGIAEFQATNSSWPCGVQEGGETPGLMLGLAGIGHFYLRLHDPDKTPPVVIILPGKR